MAIARQVAASASYGGWNWSASPGPPELTVFRSDPDSPGRLQQLGPWPIPPEVLDDAGAIQDLVLAAVASVDGDEAAELVTFEPPGWRRRQK